MLRKDCLRLLPYLVRGVIVSGVMRYTRLFITALAALPLFYIDGIAYAQNGPPVGSQDEKLDDVVPPLNKDVPSLTPSPRPPHTNADNETTLPRSVDTELQGVLNNKPDYSQVTKKTERNIRLDVLFERLKNETEADAANLIAEEVWALWLDSGSSTVDMILLRGTAYEKRGETEAARRMYDHVTTLLPDYAEGWARSARLAMEEEDYDRALAESAKALIFEPREFYALWTMGNVLEKLGRSAQAYETYVEALAIYPEHPAIKARVETLKIQIDGEVL